MNIWLKNMVMENLLIKFLYMLLVAITTQVKIFHYFLDEMKSYLDLGFTTVKMKIGGAPLKDDLKRIESVLKLVGDGKNLCVDANGRFDLKTAIEYGAAIEPYNLKWYEEAGDPLDYEVKF